MAVLIILRVFARNLLKKHFLYFVLVSGLGSNHGFTANKPTHYLLDCDDFNVRVPFVLYIH